MKAIVASTLNRVCLYVSGGGGGVSMKGHGGSVAVVDMEQEKTRRNAIKSLWSR